MKKVTEVFMTEYEHLFPGSVRVSAHEGYMNYCSVDYLLLWCQENRVDPDEIVEQDFFDAAIKMDDYFFFGDGKRKPFSVHLELADV